MRKLFILHRSAIGRIPARIHIEVTQPSSREDEPIPASSPCAERASPSITACLTNTLCPVSCLPSCFPNPCKMLITFLPLIAWRITMPKVYWFGISRTVRRIYVAFFEMRTSVQISKPRLHVPALTWSIAHLLTVFFSWFGDVTIAIPSWHCNMAKTERKLYFCLNWQAAPSEKKCTVWKEVSARMFSRMIFKKTWIAYLHAQDNPSPRQGSSLNCAVILKPNLLLISVICLLDYRADWISSCSAPWSHHQTCPAYISEETLLFPFNKCMIQDWRCNTTQFSESVHKLSLPSPLSLLDWIAIFATHNVKRKYFVEKTFTYHFREWQPLRQVVVWLSRSDTFIHGRNVLPIRPTTQNGRQAQHPILKSIATRFAGNWGEWRAHMKCHLYFWCWLWVVAHVCSWPAWHTDGRRTLFPPSLRIPPSTQYVTLWWNNEARGDAQPRVIWRQTSEVGILR